MQASFTYISLYKNEHFLNPIAYLFNLFAKTIVVSLRWNCILGGMGHSHLRYICSSLRRKLSGSNDSRVPWLLLILLYPKKPSDTEASLREKLNKIQEKLKFMALIAGYQLVANRTRHHWAMVLPLVISLCIHSGEYMLKRTKKILIWAFWQRRRLFA